ncbi:MAG: hypothetical protein AAB370_03035 [Verrucomicrobiota bacterium]
MTTCRHYRFQVPREDADEFRAADAAPCPLCDSQRKGNFQMIIWSPVNQSRRNLFTELRQRIASLLKPEPHNLPAPLSRPC